MYIFVIDSIRQQKAAKSMSKHSKSAPKIEIDRDGHASYLPAYISQTTNTQITPFLIQSLSPDLQLNKQWMIQLQDAYNDKPHSLIGNTTLIMGTSKIGKSGYAYWRYEKQREHNQQYKLFTIDCNYHSNTYSFISEFIDQIAEALEKPTSTKNKDKKTLKIQDNETLTKRLIVENNINLQLLDKHIFSRPNFKFVLVIKNCEKLVETKKQIILYTLLDWIKKEVKERMGLLFITRRLDFYQKLQKRVKSRFLGNVIFLYGPKDEVVVRNTIIARFKYAIQKAEDEEIVRAGKKMVDYFQKSKLILNLIKDQQKGPKNLYFYLEVFSLALALNFTNNQRSLVPKDIHQFEQKIKQGFEKALQHLCPYASRQRHLLLNMNFPQFIIMSIIRKMMLDERPRINLKQILNQIASWKQKDYSTSGSSFGFNDAIFERALRNLKKIRIIDIYNDKDILNGEICCFIGPESIRNIIKERKDLPASLNSYLD